MSRRRGYFSFLKRNFFVQSNRRNRFLPTTPKMQAKVRKRALNMFADEETKETADDEAEILRPSKRSKAELDGLLEAKSAHSNLIDEFEVQQSELYFNKLERKEQMETKMLDTFEIKTTAVTCSKVLYFH